MLTGIYLKLAIAALIALSVLGGAWYVHSLREHIVTLTTEVTTLKVNEVTLKTSIADQNKAIADMKAAGDVKQANADAALSKANLAIKAATAKANSIYQAKPSVAGATCEADRTSALNILNGSQP